MDQEEYDNGAAVYNKMPGAWTESRRREAWGSTVGFQATHEGATSLTGRLSALLGNPAKSKQEHTEWHVDH